MYEPANMYMSYSKMSAILLFYVWFMRMCRGKVTPLWDVCNNCSSLSYFVTSSRELSFLSAKLSIFFYCSFLKNGNYPQTYTYHFTAKSKDMKDQQWLPSLEPSLSGLAHWNQPGELQLDVHRCWQTPLWRRTHVHISSSSPNQVVSL